MKLDPPMLTEGPLTGRVYVVTHGKLEPHPTKEGETMVTASVKYDVTDQFEALATKRALVCSCLMENGDRATTSTSECPKHGPEFKRQWMAEMSEHGIVDEKAEELWQAGQAAGRLARDAARKSQTGDS